MAKPITVAVVGAGPAGFYTTEALLEQPREVAVDLIERLPTPHGLIRAGVAPDHQTTKNVTRRFEATAGSERVSFFGNVTLGSDVALDDLLGIYDAVVLATGAPDDHHLGIDGEHLQGVYGATLFVGWCNGHPEFATVKPRLDTPAAVVIGNGNVALDVARVLVKTPEEMADSDISDLAAAQIAAAPIQDVYVLGRRGPRDAKFTNVELREMGRLATCASLVDAADLDRDPAPPGLEGRDKRLQEKNLATLRSFAERAGENLPKRVHFRFYTAPRRFLGNERVEGVEVERTRVENGRAVGTGEMETIPAGMVVEAIGYRSVPIPGVPLDAGGQRVVNEDGRVAPGLYAVGWAKRGPVGVISSNRPDGDTCAAQILEDVGDGGKPGRAALTALLAERNVRVVTWDDWGRIDAAEVAAADGQRPRRKFTTVRDMLRAIGS